MDPMKLILTLADIRMRKERFARRAAAGRKLARQRMAKDRASRDRTYDWCRVNLRGSPTTGGI